MALIKSFTLPNGVTADYLRYRRTDCWDREAKVACFLFDLWLNKAQTLVADAQPVAPMAFRLQVTGATFDTWFSNAALESADLIPHIYAAAKALPVDHWAGSGVLLSDAVDDI
ncbi:hypothetical protein [Actomonas aquatica]|uniref:Uncharacterized protein n=1 Tax=Actomonas aquatica TaxID=2866162 RepID=A0ABZ1CD56_9BACT|nr:hypothetical protein [Opitutus sp. WL0086]WRQ89418.1 hypothetical protein K1X11_008350 [Opitutus sp. WL0086]